MSKALEVKCAAEEELKQWWKLAPVGEVVWRRRGCQEQWGHCIEEELVVVLLSFRGEGYFFCLII